MSRVFRGKFTAERKQQLLLQGKLQFHGSLAGNVYGCVIGTTGSNNTSTSLNVFNTTSSSPISTTPLSNGTRGWGNLMAINGLGHIFAATSVSAPGQLDEFTPTGELISPATNGYTATSTLEPATINPDTNWLDSEAMLAGMAIEAPASLVGHADTGTDSSSAERRYSPMAGTKDCGKEQSRHPTQCRLSIFAFLRGVRIQGILAPNFPIREPNLMR